MNPFESYDQAQRQAANAERRLAYKQARHAELLPDILEQERLSIALNTAAAHLQTAREGDALARRIQELMRLRGDVGRVPVPGPTQDLETREREHAAATAALAAVRERIETKERGLRQRYGLPPEA